MSEVFSVEDGVGYEWCAFAVYHHPLHEGDYAVFSDSGCSCSYWEDPSYAEQRAAEPLTRAEVRRLLVNFHQQFSSHINPGDAIRNMEAFERAMDEDAA